MEASRYDVNFFDRAVVQNPFPLYEEIRSVGRVVWNDTLKLWMIPGFDDCTAVFADMVRFLELSGDPEVVPWFEAPNMIAADGTEHQRLREPLAPLFARSAVSRWETRVREVVDRLLTPLLEGSASFDIVADFTMIPTVIIAEMLGVPELRHQDFRRWSHEIVSNLAFGHESPEARTKLLAAVDELNACMREEIERHRHEELDDLITTMLRSSELGGLSDAEVLSTAFLMLSAGYDTTAKLMSNCLVALEAHPDQRQLVVDDPSRLPAAIEEVLRWSSVVQMVPRRVVCDTIVADTHLSAGDQVYLLVAAANRDPARWLEPQRFDISREPKSHLGFGWGPHLCIGAALARLEARIAMECLLQLAPRYRLRGIDYGNGFMVRGPECGLLDAALTSIS